MAVVVIAAIASGIGAWTSGGGASGLLTSALGALIGWCVWAFVIWVIGTKVLPEASTSADIGELLRTTGFAAAPGVFAVLGLVPMIGTFLMVAASLWQLASMVVAVRQALDYTSTGRAIAVCVIGYIAMIAVVFLIVVLLGGLLAGGGLGTPSDAPAIGAAGSALAAIVG